MRDSAGASDLNSGSEGSGLEVQKVQWVVPRGVISTVVQWNLDQRYSRVPRGASLHAA